MFIEALFTIARSWKQPKCPSTDEWIKKMWYIYNGIPTIKRNEIGSFVESVFLEHWSFKRLGCPCTRDGRGVNYTLFQNAGP